MAKKSFSSVVNTPAPAELTAPAVPKKASTAGRPSSSPRGAHTVIFHIDDDLLRPLDAQVAKLNHEQSRNTSSRREVINEALRAHLGIKKQ